MSFGVDDEDRVRILRGVKLSEDVLQRMRGVANIAPERTPSQPSSPPKDTGSPPQKNQQHRAPPTPPPEKPASSAKEEQNRYRQQQQMLKDELAKVTRKREEATKAMNRERLQIRKEAEKVKQLAKQLQKKDAQLKALDAFYKEQLAQMGKKNLERYQESKEQFHEAASKTEANIRARNTEPVCLDLQTKILSCYKESGDRSLACSTLAKEYMQCIDAARKNLFINRG